MFASVLVFCLCSCRAEVFYPAEYNWIDTSDVPFYDSVYGEGFSKESDCTKITSSGTYNASSGKYRILNWLLSYDIENDGKNRQISAVYGFEAKVKSVFQDGEAGIQWMNEKNYDFYWFRIGGDGTFRIQTSIGDKKETLCNIPSAESGIQIGEFNTIKVEGLPNRNTNVYVNGKQVYTIEAEDLKITPGRLAYAYSCKSGGNAWIQLLSYQQVK